MPAISNKVADIPPDEYSWRKYGQKPIKGSPHPRLVNVFSYHTFLLIRPGLGLTTCTRPHLIGSFDEKAFCIRLYWSDKLK